MLLRVERGGGGVRVWEWEGKKKRGELMFRKAIEAFCKVS